MNGQSILGQKSGRNLQIKISIGIQKLEIAFAILVRPTQSKILLELLN